jgi:hypothetical protein
MDLKKIFATDKDAEARGRKLYLDKDKDIWLLIARRGNNAYKAYMTRVLQENSAMLGAKSEESEAMATAIFKDAAAKHLLIGWSPTGIDWGGKTNVQYSEALAREMLELQDFYDLVNNFAGEMSNYRAEEVAKDAKN